MAGQEERLGVRKQAPGTLFIEIRMLQFLTLAFLPSLDDFSPSSVSESNRPAGRMFKVFALNLPAIDERERKPVRYRRAKLFRQIECKAWTSGAIGV